LQVKVDQEVADNVENVEKLFVAASQNARQKVQ
jgi:DNA-binding protein YbaB